jgi:IS5 family transposase
MDHHSPSLTARSTTSVAKLAKRSFTKARYRGLMKNDCKLAMLFALANIARVDQMLRE